MEENKEIKTRVVLLEEKVNELEALLKYQLEVKGYRAWRKEAQK